MILVLAAAWAASGAGPTTGPAATAGATAYKRQTGPATVEVLRCDWTYPDRPRTVPAKIYYPATPREPAPVIVFSHGLGGSRDGYEYLGRHWASWGYVSVHLQHPGSDSSVWKEHAGDQDAILAAMRRAAAKPDNALLRPLDVRLALDELEKMNREAGPLHGRLDLGRTGMAGHSFGSYTTLAVAGETFIGPAGRHFQLADPRVKAAIAMSSPVPHRADHYAPAFATIAIPCLHMTGTRDVSIIGDTTAEQRRIPFDYSLAQADTYLVTFADGDHMIFSGRGESMPARKSDAMFQDLIRQSTLAFWDAYLRGDAAAKTWLTRGGFQRELGSHGAWEMKLAGMSPTSRAKSPATAQAGPSAR